MINVMVLLASAPAANMSTLPGASPISDIFKLLAGLAAVLLLMAGLAWLIKNNPIIRKASHNKVVRVIGGVPVGARERVVVLEVGDQWLIVGVTAQQVTRLGQMPQATEINAGEPEVAPQSFATWLGRSLQARKAGPTTSTEAPKE